MTVVLDDHLLRDHLAEEPSAALRRLLRDESVATTNLYHLRLCKSVESSPGGRLTGGWTRGQRRELGRALATLPDDVRVVPMRELAFRMAELSDAFRLSALGAEAVAAAEAMEGHLCVWTGDDGPNIRAAARAVGVRYRTVRA